MIIVVSYNARYAKLRGVKNAHFSNFWRSSLGWLVFGLGSTVLRILHFYHILLFSLSRAYRCFLCYALLHRFVCNLFYSSKHLYACFITFHAPFYSLQFAPVVVHLFFIDITLCVSIKSQSMDAPAWIAHIVNYKDPWQRPAKPTRAIGLCIVSSAFQIVRSYMFKYQSVNRFFPHRTLLRYLPGSHPVQRP